MPGGGVAHIQHVHSEESGAIDAIECSDNFGAVSIFKREAVGGALNLGGEVRKYGVAYR